MAKLAIRQREAILGLRGKCARLHEYARNAIKYGKGLMKQTSGARPCQK